MDSAMVACVMRLALSPYLASGFSHEALEPPFGPMMMPRYSADCETAKFAQSGTLSAIVLETSFIRSVEGSCPSGIGQHFLILRSSPETSLKGSKLDLRF